MSRLVVPSSTGKDRSRVVRKPSPYCAATVNTNSDKQDLTLKLGKLAVCWRGMWCQDVFGERKFCGCESGLLVDSVGVTLSRAREKRSANRIPEAAAWLWGEGWSV